MLPFLYPTSVTSVSFKLPMLYLLFLIKLLYHPLFDLSVLCNVMN